MKNKESFATKSAKKKLHKGKKGVARRERIRRDGEMLKNLATHNFGDPQRMNLIKNQCALRCDQS